MLFNYLWRTTNGFLLEQAKLASIWICPHAYPKFGRIDADLDHGLDAKMEIRLLCRKESLLRAFVPYWGKCGGLESAQRNDQPWVLGKLENRF